MYPVWCVGDRDSPEMMYQLVIPPRTGVIWNMCMIRVGTWVKAEHSYTSSVSG